jgi:RimJ/RimL family protein N-acetyltransferase
LKVNRITLRTRADDEKSVEAAIKFGFRVEGRQRQAYPDGCDALLFGMLRRECNFL